MNKQLTAFGLMLCACLVQAHEGHGLPGRFHWHADDAWLLLSLAAAGALGLWLARRR